jgi:7,8-dihydroneopterin aldolase/epimerase/oxygenase
MEPDRLTLRDIELSTRIGVTEQERGSEQRLLITVEYAVETERAARSDDMRKTIDYSAVFADVQSLAGTERRTIERLAEDIAVLLLRKYPIPQVTVEVKKFPLAGLREVSLQITRAR